MVNTFFVASTDPINNLQTFGSLSSASVKKKPPGYNHQYSMIAFLENLFFNLIMKEMHLTTKSLDYFPTPWTTHNFIQIIALHNKRQNLEI